MNKNRTFIVFSFLEEICSFFQIFYLTLVGIFIPPIRIKEHFKQLYFVANESLFVIIFCVGFAAIVTILETSFHMVLVIQNDSMVPGLAAVLILRELGPVVTGLLLTSRVGAGYAAEVGSMKITEQIDALKMLGIDPIRFLVVPRFTACIFGAWVLSIIASLFCLLCAALVSQWYLDYTIGSFLISMNRFVGFQDLIFASIKGACFGAVIPLVSCYYGFRCQSGAEGVGLATTNSVVTSSIMIIGLDFILSWFFSNFY